MVPSMQKGLDYLLKLNARDQVIIMLFDMPFRWFQVIEETESLHKKDRKRIVACEYSDTIWGTILLAKA